MSLIYIILPFITLIAILAILSNGVFIKAQNSSWYPLFLQSVTDTVVQEDPQSILDIGTGPGKLPELLIQKNSKFQITGIDINSAYIKEAKRKIIHPNISFQHTEAKGTLEFEDQSFDLITCCSVLFLLDDKLRSNLVNEALRVLKPGGKLIVLSPTGQTTLCSSMGEITKFPKSSYNWTYFIWKTATKQSGKKWQESHWLEKFSTNKGIAYSKKLAFNKNASIEILTKSI